MVKTRLVRIPSPVSPHLPILWPSHQVLEGRVFQLGNFTGLILNRPGLSKRSGSMEPLFLVLQGLRNSPGSPGKNGDKISWGRGVLRVEIGALVGRAGGQRPWKTYAIAQKGSNSNQALFLPGGRIHTHWFFTPVCPAYSKWILTFIAIGLLKETRARAWEGLPSSPHVKASPRNPGSHRTKLKKQTLS